MCEPRFLLLADTAGQAKVRHHRLVACVDQYVARFEVTVDDVLLVGFSQRQCDHAHKPGDHLLVAVLRCPDKARQRLALNVGHGDVRSSLVFSNVVNLADVGVTQVRGRFGLSIKTLQQFRTVVSCEFRHLQCDMALQLSVESQEDGAHGALAQFFDESVATERPSFLFRNRLLPGTWPNRLICCTGRGRVFHDGSFRPLRLARIGTPADQDLSCQVLTELIRQFRESSDQRLNIDGFTAVDATQVLGDQSVEPSVLRRVAACWISHCSP